MPGAPSPDTATTDQLIEACLRGDQSAWDAIVQRYWRKAFNVGYTFVGRHEEAEDLTAESTWPTCRRRRRVWTRWRNSSGWTVASCFAGLC
jgi:DNA-directed RNA polymerase specialized sigma24 family protein